MEIASKTSAGLFPNDQGQMLWKNEPKSTYNDWNKYYKVQRRI